MKLRKTVSMIIGFIILFGSVLSWVYLVDLPRREQAIIAAQPDTHEGFYILNQALLATRTPGSRRRSYSRAPSRGG